MNGNEKSQADSDNLFIEPEKRPRVASRLAISAWQEPLRRYLEFMTSLATNAHPQITSQ